MKKPNYGMRKKKKKPKLDNAQLNRAYRLNKVFDSRLRGKSLSGIKERVKVSKSQAGLDLDLLKNSVGKKTRMLLKNPLTKQDLDRSNRLNKVFDLKIRGLTDREIGEKLNVSHSTVSRDIKLLKKSVGKKTLKRLERKSRPRLTERELKRVYRLNKVFDLKLQGLTQMEIAKELKVSRDTVLRDLEILENAVGEKTAKKLAKKGRSKLTKKELNRAFVLNKVFGLRLNGLSIVEMSRESGLNHSKVYRALRTLIKSVEPKTVALLKNPPKKPKSKLNRVFDYMWFDFYEKKPSEIKNELERIESKIPKIPNPYLKNIMKMKRNALKDLLLVKKPKTN